MKISTLRLQQLIREELSAFGKSKLGASGDLPGRYTDPYMNLKKHDLWMLQHAYDHFNAALQDFRKYAKLVNEPLYLLKKYENDIMGSYNWVRESLGTAASWLKSILDLSIFSEDDEQQITNRLFDTIDDIKLNTIDRIKMNDKLSGRRRNDLSTPEAIKITIDMATTLSNKMQAAIKSIKKRRNASKLTESYIDLDAIAQEIYDNSGYDVPEYWDQANEKLANGDPETDVISWLTEQILDFYEDDYPVGGDMFDILWQLVDAGLT